MSVHLPRIIAPNRHVDGRGWFSVTYHEQRLREIGITCRFVQDNMSGSERAGPLRGLHFQLPPAAQAKLVSVVRGQILDVAVDIRHGSSTFGKHVLSGVAKLLGRHAGCRIQTQHHSTAAHTRLRPPCLKAIRIMVKSQVFLSNIEEF